MNIKQEKRKKFAKRYVESQIAAVLKRVSGAYQTESYMHLLNTFRNQSNALSFSESGGKVCLPAVEKILSAFVHLHASKRHWVGDVWDWQAESGMNFRSQFGSLLRHLIASHPVPQFLDAVWFSDHPDANRHRMWYRHLGQGHSLLGLRIPQLQSKSVISRFLKAPNHFEIDEAIRWAQKPLVADAMVPVYPAGLSRRRRKYLGREKSHKLWSRIGVNDWFHQEIRFDMPNIWQMRQIRCVKDLRAEGEAMRHCVASYSNRCNRGLTTIWSLRRKIMDDNLSGHRRVLTVEVLPGKKEIVEALGYDNRYPKPVEREILRMWADAAGLKIAKYI